VVTTLIAEPFMSHCLQEGGDGDDEGEHTGHTGVDRQELQNARDEEDEGEHTVTGIDGQEPQNASDDVSHEYNPHLFLRCVLTLAFSH
jgi:hypothetical protein